MGLKGGISIDADSDSLRYVFWCCCVICHQPDTFIQIGYGHTVFPWWVLWTMTFENLKKVHRLWSPHRLVPPEFWKPITTLRLKKQHGIKQNNILCFLVVVDHVISESPLARSCLMSMPSLTWMYIYDFMYHINVEHQGSHKRGAEGGFILPLSSLKLGIRKENRK